MYRNFITFEGGEASGKTTIIKAVCEFLDKNKKDYIVSREPGGDIISEQIRNVILNKSNTNMDYRCEALLYAASRVQHLNNVVIPALNENKIVILDRYIDSSFVYQGFARNLGIESIENVNYFAMEYLPNFTFFIDVTPEVALERIKINNRETNRLDLEAFDFHQKVYNGYLKLCELYPNRIIKINGNRPIEAIIEDVINTLKEKLV
jgi:dTMP kinase